jgi:CRP-like cAMP-binding protein
MNATRQSQALSQNRLLALLPKTEYSNLSLKLKSVRFKKKTLLYHTGDQIKYCYFLTAGIVSLLSVAREGKTMEVAMVGNEGIIGISVLLQTDKTPYDAITQTEIEALKIDAAVLKAEFEQDASLRAALLGYFYALLCQISQIAVCNHFHTVEQRLARRLLMSKDCLRSNTFPMTQEFSAYLLGVPRTNVTMTASILQRAGLIRYKRGTVTIINEKGLADAACDCYKIIRKTSDETLE